MSANKSNVAISMPGVVSFMKISPPLMFLSMPNGVGELIRVSTSQSITVVPPKSTQLTTTLGEIESLVPIL